jgi:hypothetical protein
MAIDTKPRIKRKLTMAIGTSQQEIEGCEESGDLRLKEKAFTRKRKLGAKKVLQILLRKVCQSLQLCLDKYFEDINETPVSKQAFSQARKHLNPEYIRKFADSTSEIAARDESKPTYKGMTLIAFDGSDIALENSAELKREFGCSGGKNNSATASCSIAFDPLNHNLYDFRIDRYRTDERILAKAHITRLLELNLGGSLLLLDRWYPSAEFIALLYSFGFQFVMRARRKFNLEADAVEGEGWINLEHDGKMYPVRVLKVVLPSGEIETLLTSLNQKQLPLSESGALYFKRWGIETAYDTIKSKLELENFSGKTKVSVLQDFYATMYLANMIAFAAEEADSIISQSDSGERLKYFRKASTNRSISKFRDLFFRIITETNVSKSTAMLDDLVRDIARYPVPFVPDMSPQRKLPRIKRFYQNRRSVV